jgi:xylulokinase
VPRNLELAGLLAGGDGPTRARRIVATGGGSADRGWMRALADATGLPVECVAEPKGGALGAAYCARAAAGLEADLSGAGRWARTGSRHEPDPRWASHCDDRYVRFVEAGGPPFDPAAGGAGGAGGAEGAGDGG